MRLAPIALVLSLVAAGAAHAGTVTVSFTNSPSHRFADAGATPWEEQSNLQSLARHLESLGQRYLPAQQTLKIEVLDVDLAGEMRLGKRPSVRELRVAKGSADWPRITVRYTLESNGKVLRSAEETIADMDYTHHLSSYRGDEPLHYEKRMLDEWFRTRFASTSE